MQAFIRELDGETRLVDLDGNVIICNVCGHPVEPCGNELRCPAGCRCLMLGCVPARLARGSGGNTLEVASA